MALGKFLLAIVTDTHGVLLLGWTKLNRNRTLKEKKSHSD